MSTTEKQNAEYKVEGMSCGHCEVAIREEVEKIPGVEVTAVDSGSGHLAISSSDPVDDAAVLAAVDEAGYEAARTDGSADVAKTEGSSCCGSCGSDAGQKTETVESAS